MANDVYSKDFSHFELLQRVSANHDYINTLNPQHIDKLGEEVSLAYSRCAVAESTLSHEEREVNELMVSSIGTIDHRLQVRSEGSLLLLYRRTIMTPTNLQALLTMCNADVRTGRVRCHAFWHIRTLSKLNSIWTIRMPTDGAYFSTHVIQTFTKAIDDDTDPSKKRIAHTPRMNPCHCFNSLFDVLICALGITKEKNILQKIQAYDWPRILQSQQANLAREGPYFMDLCLFIGLFRIAQKVLLRNPQDEQAKAFLKKLGSCHVLFDRVLQRIIDGELWSYGTNFQSHVFMEDMGPICNFITMFCDCLVPLPCNDQTNDLVRRARLSIFEPYMMGLLDGMGLLTGAVAVDRADHVQDKIGRIDALLSFIMEESAWANLQTESDASRWQRFQRSFLSHQMSEQEKNDKEMRQTLRKHQQANLEEQTGKQADMCANCFVSEKDVESGKLKTCSRCGEIAYCSRDCQRTHWKKAHKKQCQPKKQK